MKRYFYQANAGGWEVILEEEDGFEWICDCGLISDLRSEEIAKMIVNALNSYTSDR